MGVLANCTFSVAELRRGPTASLSDADAAGGREGRDAAADTASSPADAATDATPALVLRDVAVLQTVRTSLKIPGRVATPILANKPALLRAYLGNPGAHEGRALRVEFRISSLGGVQTFAEEIIAHAGTDHAATRDMGVASAQLPGESLRPDAALSVDLRDARSGAWLSSWPARGTFHPLNATERQGALRITLVPIQYDSDGSHRIPDTRPETLALYRNRFLAMYPVSEVDLQVHLPLVSTQPLSASQGWEETLAQVTALRANDAVAPDVYYMGLVAPTDTYESYCPRSCALGLSGLPDDPSDATQRASLSLGFGGMPTVTTMVHELGHAFGRYHAPCGGAAGSDRAFPYTGGGIGVWGYDNELSIAYPPEFGKDMMGYCDPSWVSDYTYAGIHERLSSVHSARTTLVEHATLLVDLLVLHEDGTFVRGGSMRVARAELRERAEADDAQGHVVLRPRVHSYALSHGSSRFVLVEHLPERVARLRLTAMP